MRGIRVAAALIAALTLAACLPVTSKTPIGTTAGVKPDPSLFGIWKGRDKDGDTPGYMSFLKNDDGTMTAILVTPPAGTDGGEWEVVSLSATTLGGHHFLHARELEVNGKTDQSPLATDGFPMLYKISGDRLTLFLLDETSVAGAIRAGKLKGTIDPGPRPGQDGDVHITADAASLDALFQTAEGIALFGKTALITLKKID
jgi:hypothetical protein